MTPTEQKVGVVRALKVKTQQLPQIIKWLVISLIVAFMAGTASAAFLAALKWATNWREQHLWIVLWLPFGGFLVGWLYLKFGKSVEAGNNLLLDEVHDPKKTIPARMTPLVLFGTVMSHFFGASVGREGTAIQMGGSLADQLSKPLRMTPEDRRVLLMTGMSAGFASVFGIPLAGAVFGFEVLAIGRLRYNAIFPCFVAAIVANRVTLAWGIRHPLYVVPSVPELNLATLFSALLAGAVFGLIAMLFANSTHKLGGVFKSKIRYAPMRPFLGGVAIAAAVWLLGTSRYLGLGLPTIMDSFGGHVAPWDFFGKFVFTSWSLGAGFKGGEVTPLFFIGSTLGNTLSYVLPLPAPLLAAMGLVAVFGGAANTPISSMIMAMELFGPQAGVYAGLACVMSYLFSGHASIYHSQRIGTSKIGLESAMEDIRVLDLDHAKRIRSIDQKD